MEISGSKTLFKYNDYNILTNDLKIETIKVQGKLNFKIFLLVN